MKTLLARVLAPAVVLTGFFALPAKALNYVDLTFTGTGVNGLIASGTFTVDGDSALVPFYSSNGSIYPALALTITGIPGGGPTAVSFDLNDINSTWFNVDGAGTPFIAPYGSHNFGAPEMNHYDLGQPSQPDYPGSFVFVTNLSYNGVVKDTITWSAASLVAVPEPSAFATLAGAAALACGLIARRRTRRV